MTAASQIGISFEQCTVTYTIAVKPIGDGRWKYKIFNPIGTEINYSETFFGKERAIAAAKQLIYELLIPNTMKVKSLTKSTIYKGYLIFTYGDKSWNWSFTVTTAERQEILRDSGYGNETQALAEAKTQINQLTQTTNQN